MADAYSVSEITEVIRAALESHEGLQDIRVQGEVSNFKAASSGHWYFTLKDGSAQLGCVMWRNNAIRQALSFRPVDGDAIAARGSIGVYPDSGRYQLYVTSLRRDEAVVGDLYAQFEALKQKLETEGLFDSLRKAERLAQVPEFPARIGIVTSPEAAAYQDVQNVLRRRYPLAEVILSPTLVQGAEAPVQIIRALQRLNDYGQVDVILLIRGGGSIEDLWAFNDEGVARAIHASRIPVVTGVGHEIDWTIADFVSDLRAPTPSAAAELITPDSAELRTAVGSARVRLGSGFAGFVRLQRNQLDGARRTLGYLSPTARVRAMRQRLDDWAMRLTGAQVSRVALLHERLNGKRAALLAADPRAILKRGYAIVYRSDDGTPLTRAAGTMPGAGITVQFLDGELKARVEDKDSHERYQRTLF